MRTWSTWSHAEAVEERTVVSEIGAQWSPKIAPARTELIVPSRIEYCIPAPKSAPPPSDTVRGITSGSRIVIVPQDVPVAKDIAAATTKTSHGSRRSATLPSRIWVR